MAESNRAEIMKDDWFTVEESRELLRVIFPNYPDLRGVRPVPNLKEFLQELRKK
jgi:hypothetical protein